MNEAIVVPNGLVRAFAREELSPDELSQQAKVHFPDTSPRKARALLRAMLSTAEGHARRSQFGQLGGVLVLGLSILGLEFIDAVHSRRLLKRPADRKYADYLHRLCDRLDRAGGVFQIGSRSIRSHALLQDLHLSAEADHPLAVAAINTRPFAYGRTLVAILNLAFLRHYHGMDDAAEASSMWTGCDTPEHVASAVSSVLATANASRPLTSIDFTLPVAGLVLDEGCKQLISFGKALHELAEAEKLVTILNYRLERRDSPLRTVVVLEPPELAVEYALRLGFVRTGLGGVSAPLHLAQHKSTTLHTMDAAVDAIIEAGGASLAQIVDADGPFKRLRVLIPLVPEWLQRLGRYHFYEDAVMHERLAQELEAPLRQTDKPAFRLTNDLDWEAFTLAWRAIRLLNLIDVRLLMQQQADSTVVLNSLLRISPWQSLADCLGGLGLSDAAAADFSALMCTDLAAPGHVDLQYRPFILLPPSETRIGTSLVKAPKEIVSAPAVVVAANAIPNVLRANALRVEANARALVASVAATLRPLSERIRVDAAVKGDGLATDVDVVCVVDRVMYLFECKHSMPPTSAHELRNLWQDIQKGVGQLERAEKILEQRRHNYLAGWFPGLNKRESDTLRIQKCVVCSHRVFAGLEIRGVPIRDYPSLAFTLGHATVQMGEGDEAGNVLLERYRLRPSDDVTGADLTEFLSPDSRFFGMFRSHMRPCSKVERVSHNAVLAKNTFVCNLAPDTWRDALVAMGAVRLVDQVVQVGPSGPPMPEQAV